MMGRLKGTGKVVSETKEAVVEYDMPSDLRGQPPLSGTLKGNVLQFGLAMQSHAVLHLDDGRAVKIHIGQAEIGRARFSTNGDFY